MQRIHMSDYVQDMRKDKKIKQKIGVVVLALSLITALIVLWQMKLTGIAMAGDAHCGIEEHVHTAECEERVLTCTSVEGEAHYHTDGCYEVNSEITCGFDEHTHTDECYSTEKVLICTEEHEHGEECYEEQKILICEATEHTHTPDCCTEEKVLVCETAEGEGHVHTDNCYTVNYICGLSEHVHTLSCYSDANADKENADDWEKSFESAEITDDFKSNIINIAETQLGYTESERNFSVDDDGVRHGYTRYGDWYGAPYVEWNTAFVSFCLHYAEVPSGAVRQGISAYSQAQALIDNGSFRYPSDYVPTSGDIVYFDTDLNGNADRAAVVADTDSEYIYVIEGGVFEDAENENGIVPVKVEKRSVPFTDETLLGYADIDSAIAFYENDYLVRTFENDKFTVTATLSEDTEIPLNAELFVEQVTVEEHSEQFEEISQSIENSITEENIVLSDIAVFNIGFMSGGEVIETDEEYKATIEFKEALFPKQVTSQSSLSLVDVTDGEVNDIASEQSVIEGAEFGITSISFLAGKSSSFALTVKDSQKTGTFYHRVSTIDSTSDRYLIVSAEGSYALTRGTNNYTAVDLNPVNGNPKYYEISDVSSSMLWTFGTKITGTSGTSTIRNYGNTSYYVRMGNSTFISTTSATNTLTYKSDNESWTVSSGSYYLYNTGEGAFTRSSTTTNTQIHNRDVLILKEVSTTLTIPGTDSDSGEGSGGSETETRPTYDPYIETADSIKGDVVVDITTGLNMEYASDKATSQLESRFTGTSDDNGLILTDKSVIYGEDDYGAYTDFEDDQFSVVLSALAQQYEITEENKEFIPIDVVLILDTSGSMEFTINGEKRGQTVITATNTLINKIMGYHPANRVGIVTFNSDSGDFLPLSRYYVGTEDEASLYADNNNYPEESPEYLTYQEGTSSNSTAYINTNSNLRNISSPSSSINITKEVELGTYTQAGIARAAAMYLRNAETSYTTKEGEEVIRTPLVILLSDGEPTHCTSNYSDVLAGPHYGNGVASATSNNKGVLGYYTILSANYYKAQITRHYLKQAKFYTIGMGIYETGIEDASTDYNNGTTNSVTGDHYKRAVLNPSSENVEALVNDNAKNHATNADMLRSMLLNTYTDHAVEIGATSTYVGQRNAFVPIIQNPYTNYNYADGAYFKEDYDPAALINIFDQIVLDNMEERTYISSLTENTDLIMEDTIGQGMEIQSDVTLRYNGVNYSPTSITSSGNVTSYKYTGVVNSNHYSDPVNLSSITVTVTTFEDGTQKIHWEIPGSLVPEYVRSQTASWYYEELPVRIIFKVGLKDSIREEVENGKRYGEKFYTNSRTEPTRSWFVPTDNNPYFKGDENINISLSKSENTTGTRETYYEIVENADNVTTVNGNNGYLVFTQGDIPEPKPGDETGDISVQKLWRDINGREIDGAESINVELWYEGTKTQQAHSVTVNYVYGSNTIATSTVDNVRHGASVSYAAGSRSAQSSRFTVSSSDVTGDATVSTISRGSQRSGGTTYYYVNAFTVSNIQSDVTVKITIGTRSPNTAALATSGTASETGTNSSTHIDARRLTTVSLSKSNAYTYTWNNLVTKTLDDEGFTYEYIYFIVEPEHDGYEVTYSNNDGIKSGTITVTNIAGYELPATGGSGNTIFFIGILIIALSIAVFAVRITVRRKDDYDS